MSTCADCRTYFYYRNYSSSTVGMANEENALSSLRTPSYRSEQWDVRNEESLSSSAIPVYRITSFNIVPHQAYPLVEICISRRLLFRIPHGASFECNVYVPSLLLRILSYLHLLILINVIREHHEYLSFIHCSRSALNAPNVLRNAWYRWFLWFQKMVEEPTVQRIGYSHRDETFSLFEYLANPNLSDSAKHVEVRSVIVIRYWIEIRT